MSNICRSCALLFVSVLSAVQRVYGHRTNTCLIVSGTGSQWQSIVYAVSVSIGNLEHSTQFRATPEHIHIQSMHRWVVFSQTDRIRQLYRWYSSQSRVRPHYSYCWPHFLYIIEWWEQWLRKSSPNCIELCSLERQLSQLIADRLRTEICRKHNTFLLVLSFSRIGYRIVCTVWSMHSVCSWAQTTSELIFSIAFSVQKRGMCGTLCETCVSVGRRLSASDSPVMPTMLMISTS